VGKLTISHRYNRLPLLPSGPGGVQQELVVWDLPVLRVQKYQKSFIVQTFLSRFG